MARESGRHQVKFVVVVSYTAGFFLVLFACIGVVQEAKPSNKLNGEVPSLYFPVLVENPETHQVRLVDLRQFSSEIIKSERLVTTPKFDKKALGGISSFEYEVRLEGERAIARVVVKNSDNKSVVKYSITNGNVVPEEITVYTVADGMIAFPFAVAVFVFLVILINKPRRSQGRGV